MLVRIREEGVPWMIRDVALRKGMVESRQGLRVWRALMDGDLLMRVGGGDGMLSNDYERNRYKI